MTFNTRLCKIISGANQNRFNAFVNHKKYADHRNLKYEFYLRPNRTPPYYIKIDTILENFEYYNYLMYIDDDAFFLDRHWDCTKIFETYVNFDLIVTSGFRGLFNSGVMFLKKSTSLINLLEQVEKIDRQHYLENWNTKEWDAPGQDLDNARLIYLTQTILKDKTKIIDYPGFNCKELHFSKGYSSPIVHFTSRNKQGKMNRFERNHQSLYDI